MIKNSRARHSMLNVKIPEKAKGKEGGKEMVFVFQPEHCRSYRKADSSSYFDDEVLRDMLTCDFEHMQKDVCTKKLSCTRVCGAANPAPCLWSGKSCTMFTRTMFTRTMCTCTMFCVLPALYVPALCFVYCLDYVSVLTIRHDHKQHDNCPPPTADNCPPPPQQTALLLLPRQTIYRLYNPTTLLIYITCLSTIYMYIIFFFKLTQIIISLSIHI